MRLDSGDSYDLDIKGNGVFSEDPTIPETPERPLVSEMPEVAVIINTPEVPDELDLVRGKVLNINNIPGAPAPARSGFGRDPEDTYDN